jgi:hypothetical protein
VLYTIIRTLQNLLEFKCFNPLEKDKEDGSSSFSSAPTTKEKIHNVIKHLILSV